MEAGLTVPGAAIITAIYGRYDTLKAAVPQDGMDVEWVLVTDDRKARDGHLGWRVVYAPAPDVTPMRAAKAAKFRPWEFTQAPASVWVDASCQVTSATLARDFLAKAAPVATFAHTFRDCLYAEAQVAAGMFKYDGEPVAEQAAHYLLCGHPPHWGLWETTIIGRHHTPAVRALGEAWAAEMARWSSQDQVSFPFALRQSGLRPQRMPGGRAGSPWHELNASDRHDDRIRA